MCLLVRQPHAKAHPLGHGLVKIGHPVKGAAKGQGVIRVVLFMPKRGLGIEGVRSEEQRVGNEVTDDLPGWRRFLVIQQKHPSIRHNLGAGRACPGVGLGHIMHGKAGNPRARNGIDAGEPPLLVSQAAEGVTIVFIQGFLQSRSAALGKVRPRQRTKKPGIQGAQKIKQALPCAGGRQTSQSDGLV